MVTDSVKDEISGVPGDWQGCSLEADRLLDLRHIGTTVV
jgi:hypothetical protein